MERLALASDLHILESQGKVVSNDQTLPASESRLATGATSTSQSESLFEDCWHQLAYSAIQKPIAGVCQIVDSVAKTHLVKTTDFMDVPLQADKGSFRWHMEHIASGVGAAVPYLASLALARKGMKIANAERLFVKDCSSAAHAVARYRTAEAATAGFVDGALFEPSEPGHNILVERLRQGTTSGVAMGTMHHFSNKLTAIVATPGESLTAFERLSTVGFAGAGSGVAASVTDATLHGKVPTLANIYESAYTNAFTGIAMSEVAGSYTRLHQMKSSFPSLENRIIGDDFLSKMPVDETNGAKLSCKSAIERVELVRRLQEKGAAKFLSEDGLNKLIDKLDNAIGGDTQDNLPGHQQVSAEARAGMMEKAVNDFLKEQNLPGIKISAASTPQADASYSNGRIAISPEIVATPKLTATQVEILVHELVHLEQDVLRLRYLADELNLGKCDPQSVRELRDAERESSVHQKGETVRDELRPSAEFIGNVLRLRNGRRLSVEQYIRAEKVINAAKNYRNAPWNEARDKAEAQYRQCDDFIDFVDEHEVAEFLSTLKENPDGIKQQYGFEQLPARLRQGSSVAPSVEEVTNIFKEQRDSLEKALMDFAKQDHDRYMANPLEREAYPAGFLGQWLAQSRGFEIKPPPPRPTQSGKSN